MKTMQRIFFILLIMGISFPQISAQISEKTMPMSLGTNPGWLVKIEEADEDRIEDNWRDFMKQYGRIKRDRKTKEYFGDNLKISSISGSGTVDVFARAEDEKLSVFFGMGDSFVTSANNSKAARGVEDLLEDFRYEVIRDMIREEIKAEDKALSKLMRELKHLEKDNERYNKIIEKAREDIIEAEANIEQNLLDQEAANKKIEEQRLLLEKINAQLQEVGKK